MVYLGLCKGMTKSADRDKEEGEGRQLGGRWEEENEEGVGDEEDEDELVE